MRKTRATPAYARLTTALKEARLKAGLQQIEAARKLRKPQSFVSKVESGERRLDVIELAELLRAYGQDVIGFLRSLQL